MDDITFLMLVLNNFRSMFVYVFVAIKSLSFQMLIQKVYHFSLVHISPITYSFSSRLFVGKNKYAYFIACNKVIILFYLNQTQTFIQHWPRALNQSIFIHVHTLHTLQTFMHNHTRAHTQEKL